MIENFFMTVQPWSVRAAIVRISR